MNRTPAPPATFAISWGSVTRVVVPQPSASVQ